MKSKKLVHSSDREDMPWLLIDCSWLAYRCRWSLHHSWNADASDLMIYAFLDQVRYICNDNNCLSNKVIVLLDSPKRLRKELFSGYKSSRSELTAEELQEKIAIKKHLKDIVTVLTELGVPCFEQEGYEADDLIAQCCYQFPQFLFSEGPQAKVQAVMLTSDQDLFQCITASCHWYDPMRRIYLGPQAFIDLKGIVPCTWVMVKAVAGCSGDSVPGIKGFGETTAIKYLSNKLCKGRLFDRVTSDDGRRIIKRNLALVRLPLEGTQPIKLERPNWSRPYFDKLVKKMPGLIDGERKLGWNKILTGRFSMEGLQRDRLRMRNNG